MCPSPIAEHWTLPYAGQRPRRGPGEVVLLSPAAASFDQFRDFEARGDAFRAAVEALGQEGAA
jgi:UDP-N-acetylmuramoylalanine--D-glutamate ligase